MKQDPDQPPQDQPRQPVDQPSEGQVYSFQTTPLERAPVGSAQVDGAVVEQPSVPRPSSKLKNVVTVFGLFQLVGVGLYVALILGLVQQARSGVSGTEFVGLLLMMIFVPLIGVVALINLIILPIYLLRQSPKGKGLAFAVASLICSIALVGYAGYSAFSMFVVFPGAMNDRAEQSRQLAEKYAAERAKASYEISKEDAIGLLQGCKLKGFYYTDQTDRSAGGWGELSGTGVVVTEVDGAPYRISIADKLIPELVPIAREAQKTCGGPQFWHDGRYEQYSDGKWYFGTEAVN